MFASIPEKGKSCMSVAYTRIEPRQGQDVAQLVECGSGKLLMQV